MIKLEINGQKFLVDLNQSESKKEFINEYLETNGHKLLVDLKSESKKK
jgi:aerobic-type carbon monoxide dehydrogenase small subunit (CoxS/CutS family)